MMLLANCPKLSGSLDFLWLPPTQKGGLREFANNIMKGTRPYTYCMSQCNCFGGKQWQVE